ncbi:hypothetical protein MBT84_22010 [Streptomyces sp. MBT84]|nr:hypothetical protein [Streptomyces sp. MBT84]
MPRDLDLRHVISPAIRDLIELANLGDFDRTRDQVSRLRGCTRPVNLVGHTHTRDAATGETIRSYSTSDEPTGRLLTTCGNRRASRCATCSRVYAADTYHLIRAGLSGGKSVPETVRSHPRVFATLTAPSFGPVHNRPTTKDGKPHACRCGQHHADDAPELGTPLHPATYDYTGAVLWNAHAGALWARFTLNLRRALAAHFGITQKDMKQVLRVSFAKVAEYQKRGLVHLHAVIRIDGPDGHTSSPPSWATVDDLTHAIHNAVPRTALTVTSDTIGDHEIRWDRCSTYGRSPRSATANSPTPPWPDTSPSTPPRALRTPAPSTVPWSAAPAPAAAPSAAVFGTCAPTAKAPARPNLCGICLYTSTFDR